MRTKRFDCRNSTSSREDSRLTATRQRSSSRSSAKPMAINLTIRSRRLTPRPRSNTTLNTCKSIPSVSPHFALGKQSLKNRFVYNNFFRITKSLLLHIPFPPGMLLVFSSLRQSLPTSVANSTLNINSASLQTRMSTLKRSLGSSGVLRTLPP